jgi:hypothetical protein
VEAGWGLWALGFPVTDWARDLLIAEVRSRRDSTKKAEQSLGRGRGRLLRTVTGARPPKGIAKMRKALPPDRMPTVLRMMVEFHLGSLREADYTPEDFERFQDAVLSEFWPELLDDDELLQPREVAAVLAKLAQETSPSRTIKALKEVDTQHLEQYRNELQWLTEAFAAPDQRPDAIMDRSDFIRFFKARHMDPNGQRGMAALLKTLGRTHSPPSALRRWHLAGRRGAASLKSLEESAL